MKLPFHKTLAFPLTLVSITLWHLLWWFVLVPQKYVIAKQNTTLAFAEFLLYPEDASDGIRATWSPLLFSLPSAAGFSKSLLKDKAGAEPPLDFQENFSYFTPMALDNPTKHIYSLISTLQSEATERILQASFNVAVKDPFNMTDTFPAWQWETGGGLDAASFKGINFDILTQNIPLSKGKLILSLDVDRYGFLEGCFVEISSGDTAADQYIIRMLYSFQLSGVTQPASGILELEWNREGELLHAVKRKEPQNKKAQKIE